MNTLKLLKKFSILQSCSDNKLYLDNGKEMLPLSGGGDYQEKICGFENVEDVLPETELVPNMSMGAYPITSVLSMPVVGQMCRIKYKGVEYLCQVKPSFADPTVEQPVEIGVQIGNLGVMTGSVGDGEPFFIMLVYPEYRDTIKGFAGLVRFKIPDGAGSQYQPENEIISIVRMDVLKIPELFIPTPKVETVIIPGVVIEHDPYRFTFALQTDFTELFATTLKDKSKVVRIRLENDMGAHSDFEFGGYDADTGAAVFKTVVFDFSEDEYTLIREYRMYVVPAPEGAGEIKMARIINYAE